MVGSARRLLEGYREGAVLPSEVVEQLRDRWRARQDAVGAFAATRWDGALVEALEHDAAYRRGSPRGALAGVPLAVKDLIDTADCPTEYGSPVFGGHRPARDADVVAAARRAGAIVVGKTVTHEFGWGITSLSVHGSRCRNSLDPERIAGGSSGGSAAAVADGQVPLAIGTDTAGSVRIPAAFCGATGFKPTFDTISTRGCWPLAPSLDHVGVIVGDPLDAVPLVQALCGMRPGPGPEAAAPAVAVDPDAPVSVRRALAGAPLETLEGEALDWKRANRCLRTIQGFEAIAVHRAAGLYPERRDQYGEDVRLRLDRAAGITEAAYVEALDHRESMRQRCAAAFAGQDILVSAAATIDPPEVAELGEDGADSRLRDGLIPNFAPQSLFGLPACVIPIQAERGSPSSLQVTGRRGCDDLVLATAAAIFMSAAAATAPAPRPSARPLMR